MGISGYSQLRQEIGCVPKKDNRRITDSFRFWILYAGGLCIKTSATDLKSESPPFPKKVVFASEINGTY